MGFLKKWLWDYSAFTLAICVLSALVAGWDLPATYDAVMGLAFAEIAMAIVVAIREGKKIFYKHEDSATKTLEKIP